MTATRRTHLSPSVAAKPCIAQPLHCPATVLREDVGGRMQAVQEMHEPSSHVELEEARRRLAFEELLLLQLTLLLRRELSRCAQLRQSGRPWWLPAHLQAASGPAHWLH